MGRRSRRRRRGGCYSAGSTGGKLHAEGLRMCSAGLLDQVAMFAQGKTAEELSHDADPILNRLSKVSNVWEWHVGDGVAGGQRRCKSLIS